MKINSQPSPIRPSYPWVTLENLTIHTISQSLTLSNFFYKTPGKFEIGHNIGKVEIYENKFSTFSPFLPSHPYVALKNLTIHTMAQSFTLSNFFHKTPGEFKFGHNIDRIEIYENKFSTLTPFVSPTPG